MHYEDAKTLEWRKGPKQFFMSNRNFDSALVRRYLAIRTKMVYKSQRHGVDLLLETDAAQILSVPGFALHREPGIVKAELTPTGLCGPVLTM